MTPIMWSLVKRSCFKIFYCGNIWHHIIHNFRYIPLLSPRKMESCEERQKKAWGLESKSQNMQLETTELCIKFIWSVIYEPCWKGQPPIKLYQRLKLMFHLDLTQDAKLVSSLISLPYSSDNGVWSIPWISNWHIIHMSAHGPVLN